MSRTNIFISYSHQDRKWKDRLLVHLAAFQDYQIEAWDDSRLQTGDKWRQEIVFAMDSAKIAVLLISADFLASPFIRDVEIPHLIERNISDGMQIYPLIVGPSNWDSIPWISEYQVRPLWGHAPIATRPEQDAESVLSATAKEIRDLLSVPSLLHLPSPGDMLLPTPPTCSDILA